MITAIEQLIAALEEAIATPVDGALLADLGQRWIRGEGDRYFLRGDVRALFAEVAAVTPGEPVDPDRLTRWMITAQDLRRQLSPVRNPYLDPATARLRAIALGIYSEETAPSVERFAAMLDRLCDVLHQWLGRRLAVTTYKVTVRSDHWGRLRLPEWPVLGLESIAIQGYSATGIPLMLTPIRVYWQGTREIDTGFRDRAFDVTYTAGLDPVPEVVRDCLVDLLGQVASQDPALQILDVTWFSAPFREVESVELPGGLAKRFSIPESGAVAVSNPPSYLDRLLYPLLPYRLGSLQC